MIRLAPQLLLTVIHLIIHDLRSRRGSRLPPYRSPLPRTILCPANPTRILPTSPAFFGISLSAITHHGSQFSLQALCCGCGPPSEVEGQAAEE